MIYSQVSRHNMIFVSLKAEYLYTSLLSSFLQMLYPMGRIFPLVLLSKKSFCLCQGLESVLQQSRATHLLKAFMDNQAPWGNLMWLNSNKGTFHQNINNTIMKNIKSYVLPLSPLQSQFKIIIPLQLALARDWQIYSCEKQRIQIKCLWVFLLERTKK